MVEGFSLLVEGREFQNPETLSSGMQTAINVAAFAAYGLVGSMSTGYMDKTDKRELIEDLKKMREYCDLVGVKLKAGSVQVQLGIAADDISFESLIGRFALIHERVFDFQKYAASLVRTVFSDGKLSTIAEVVVVFSAHSKANEFIQKYAEKCKHSSMRKNVYTQPWVVDLEDREITRLRMSLTNWIAKLIPSESEKLRAALFRARFAET